MMNEGHRIVIFIFLPFYVGKFEAMKNPVTREALLESAR